LKDSLGLDAELKPGGKGIFDVHLDNRLIFSKYDVHRFPNAGEVPQLIESYAKGAT
jgi:hypothetical protein